MSYVHLGDSAKKELLKIKKAKASGAKDTFWDDLNAAAATTLSPIAPAINALPIMTDSEKALLISYPLEAMLSLTDVIMEPLRRAVQHTINRVGAHRVLFGSSIDITLSPASDRKASASTQKLLTDLRTIRAFMVLFFTKPLELAEECAKQGLDLAQSMTTAAADGFKAATSAISNAAKGVMSMFSGYVYETGLGQEPTTDTAILASVTGAAGAALTTALTAAIEAIVNAVVDAGTSMTVDAINNAVTPAAAKSKVDNPPTLTSSQIRPTLPPSHPTQTGMMTRPSEGMPSWVPWAFGLGALGVGAAFIIRRRRR